MRRSLHRCVSRSVAVAAENLHAAGAFSWLTRKPTLQTGLRTFWSFLQNIFADTVCKMSSRALSTKKGAGLE